MRARSALLFVSLLAPACGGGTTDVPLAVITQDNASDETWLAIFDKDAQGLTTADDTKAAALTAPTPGQALPAATPFTFSWTAPNVAAGKVPRHGIETGSFVWLNLDGPGMDAPVDVVSLTSRSFTPDAATWAKITAATGTVTARIISAYCNQGLVEQGPFEPTAAVTFTIAP